MFDLLGFFRKKATRVNAGNASRGAAGVEDGDFAKRISDETGCSYQQALDLLEQGRKAGLTDSRYLGIKGWDFTGEELPAFLEAQRKLSERNAAWREWYVSVVCERTGWSRADALARMDAAKEKGYTYRKFITCALYKKTDEELSSIEPFSQPKKAAKAVSPSRYRVAQKAVMNRELPFKPKNNPTVSKRTSTISDTAQADCAKVIEATGWTIGALRTNFALARASCGCTFDEYVKYRMYAMSPEEQLEYVTQETHLKMQIRYVDFGGDCDHLENKGKFNTMFSEHVHRRWFLSEGLTYEDFEKNIAGLDYLFVKDLAGIGGFNAGKYRVNESAEQNRKVFSTIQENPNLICEQCFKQHKDISELYPDAVSTIRLFTFFRDGKVDVLFAGLRVGLSGVVDNLSSGGMMCGINLETGEIETYGATKKSERIVTHPTTGVPFLGRRIPAWDEAVAMVKKAALLLPANPYVGWDVAISEDGVPELIEGNHNPAAWIMQISWVVGPEVRGNRYIVDALADDFSNLREDQLSVA